MGRDFSRKFYHSKEWESVRQYILRRDNYLCVRCNAPGKEIHHKTYLTPENINDPDISLNPDNLITLCRDCHMDEHRQQKIDGVIKKKAESRPSACDDEYEFDSNGILRPIKKPDDNSIAPL